MAKNGPRLVPMNWMKIEKDLEDNNKRIADIKKRIKIGCKALVKTCKRTVEGYVYRIDRCTVEEIYKHFVVLDVNGYKESFKWNDILDVM